MLADYERTLGDATDPEESMRSWQNRYGGFVDLHETMVTVKVSTGWTVRWDALPLRKITG